MAVESMTHQDKTSFVVKELPVGPAFRRAMAREQLARTDPYGKLAELQKGCSAGSIKFNQPTEQR